MIKARIWILTWGLIVAGASLAGGQGGPPPGQPPWMSPGQAPPGFGDMEDMRKAEAQLIREASPELFAFQERLRKIEEDIGKILANFSSKRIDKADAKEKIQGLIKEEQAIRNDPDFLAEQRLLQAYVASPDYQAKVKKMMRGRKKSKPGE